MAILAGFSWQGRGDNDQGTSAIVQTMFDDERATFCKNAKKHACLANPWAPAMTAVMAALDGPSPSEPVLSSQVPIHEPYF